MGMELLIAIIAVGAIVILWAIRKDVSIGADTEKYVPPQLKTDDDAVESVTVTVTQTEKTEVFVEDDKPAPAKKKAAPKKKPAAKKVAAPKTKAAAPKKKVAAPKKKVAAPKKKVAAPKKKAAPKK